MEVLTINTRRFINSINNWNRYKDRRGSNYSYIQPIYHNTDSKNNLVLNNSYVITLENVSNKMI